MNVLVTPVGFDDKIVNRTFREQYKPFGVYKMPRTIFNPHKRKLNGPELAELIDRYQPAGMIAGLETLDRRTMETAELERRIMVLEEGGNAKSGKRYAR